ncbi:M23 family metallopeptidase [Cellulomonas triticagri]|uniref:M23 family metallopeptidase n=1 Tax=Cellulomonas triticagri TaxID=2483352 RepID=A0A3M2JIM2_9CELL|nr:M23 family metallopeptidase [Cellulomonas triticagri]RMI13499.1 M23 family metallopeptidase [Cellulomonas triticagri]
MDDALDLRYPFDGRWQVRNSPADRVPSHGTGVLASAYAIDFVPVDAAGRSGWVTVATLFLAEPPERFVGFGRPVLAPLAGVVLATRDAVPDHAARRGLLSLADALGQRRRLAGGWQALAGNHVLLGHDGVVVALCHLQRGSVSVRPGQVVAAGDVVGRCGCSGNSTEPHLHLQALDDPDPARARAVPVTFGGRLPRGGEVVEPAP